jgi:hypothetical protein
MAFHMPKQFWGYGPVNFLAAWHFEQIDGILQKVPSNKKISTQPFYYKPDWKDRYWLLMCSWQIKWTYLC